MKESPEESVVEEVFGRGSVGCIEEGAEVITVAVVGEPALLFNKAEEHQSVEEALGIESALFLFRFLGCLQ